jgi:hypothetical protein
MKRFAMTPVYLAAWLLLALGASSRTSSAQPSDPKAAAAADASGRAHFQRGQRLSARSDYAAAYREFAAGYAVTGRPLFLFNMGEAARASGDADKARESYLEFLRVDPRSALAATARARLAQLDASNDASAGSRAPGAPSAPSAASRSPSEATTSAGTKGPPGSGPAGSRPATSAAGSRPAGSASAGSAPAGSPRTASGPASSAPGSGSAGSAPGGSGSASSRSAASAASGAARAEGGPLSPPSSVPPREPQASVVERAAPQRVATAPDGESAPVWKKWPFWAVVGGAIAGGVAVYAVTRSRGSACGTNCSELNFR